MVNDQSLKTTKKSLKRAHTDTTTDHVKLQRRSKKPFKAPTCKSIDKLDPLPQVLLNKDKTPTVTQYLKAVCQATGAIQLGKGGFGVVNRYCIPELGIVVAGKRGFTDDELDTHLMVTLCQLEKPNQDWFAVPLIDVVKCSNGIVIVMPMYPKTLTAFLNELINADRKEEAVSAIYKTFAALDRLHKECGVVHWDFKTDNVLVNYDGDPHISDFGLSWRLDDLVNPGDADFILPIEYFFFIEDMVRNSPNLEKQLLPAILDWLQKQEMIPENTETFDQLVHLWKTKYSKKAKHKKYPFISRPPFEDAYVAIPELSTAYQS